MSMLNIKTQKPKFSMVDKKSVDAQEAFMTTELIDATHRSGNGLFNQINAQNASFKPLSSLPNPPTGAPPPAINGAPPPAINGGPPPPATSTYDASPPSAPIQGV